MNVTRKALSTLRHSALVLAAFVAIASTAASAAPLAQSPAAAATSGYVSTNLVTFSVLMRRWFPIEPRRNGG